MKERKVAARQVHPIEPIFSASSEILILGSFPSVQSRADGFYYAHPQNRFWRVLAAVYGEAVPVSHAEKTDFILSHGLALWDVIASCEITGSSDSSIANVIPTDLARICREAPIKRIYVNGKTAERYYRRYQLAATGLEPTVLPSTSAANAACSLEHLAAQWQRIRT